MKLPLLLAFPLLLPASVLAGDLRCRLVVVDSADQLPDDLRLVDAASGDSERIEAGNSLEAGIVEIRSSGKLLLESAADGETIAELQVAPELTEAVLFLLPSEGLSGGDSDEDGGGDGDEGGGDGEGGGESDDKGGDHPVPWTCVVAEWAPDALDEGGVAFVNGSRHPARLSLGSTTEPVEAASVQFLGDPAEDKDDFNMVPVKVEVEMDGRWRRLKDGTSRFAGDVVYWLVGYDQSGNGRPRLRIFKSEIGG